MQYKLNLEHIMEGESLRVCSFYRHSKTGDRYWLDGVAAYAGTKLAIYHKHGALAGNLQACHVEHFARNFEYIAPKTSVTGWR